MDSVTPASLNADEAGEAVRHAQAELERAVREGGLSKDPMRLPLGALAVTLGAQHQFHLANVRQLRAVASDIEQQMSTALEAARRPADPAVVDRLEKAAARGADRRSAELARAHNLRTLLTYGGAFAAAVLAAAIGGAVWGSSNQVATVRSTEAGVSAAFRDGPAAAASWLNLMKSNDPAQALAACVGANIRVIEGRRACNVPIWLDPPTQNVPR